MATHTQHTLHDVSCRQPHSAANMYSNWLARKIDKEQVMLKQRIISQCFRWVEESVRTSIISSSNVPSFQFLPIYLHHILSRSIFFEACVYACMYFVHALSVDLTCHVYHNSFYPSNESKCLDSVKYYLRHFISRSCIQSLHFFNTCRCAVKNYAKFFAKIFSNWRKESHETTSKNSCTNYR